MTDLLGHALVFGAFIILFLLVALLIGRFVRPKLPTPEKEAVYECGEPTIGTSYVQFDLRFYVVALLFIIFDVEVAFFFPWATVFGGAMQLADTRLAEHPAAQAEVSAKLLNVAGGQPLPPGDVIAPDTARLLGVTGLVDILVFFGVLLVGFAYVWYRGDLDWVRAVTRPATARPQRTPVKVEQSTSAKMGQTAPVKVERPEPIGR